MFCTGDIVPFVEFVVEVDSNTTFVNFGIEENT